MTEYVWRLSKVDCHRHAIPSDRLSLDPEVVYDTACGTGLTDDLAVNEAGLACLRCVKIAGPAPVTPIPEGSIAWWTGPSTGHPNDMSHAFAADDVNDPTRTTYQALGCDYTVLASEVTPFPTRRLCGPCLMAIAGRIADKGVWR